MPPDILVECLDGVPDDILTGARLVFKAANADMDFYSIYKSDSGLIFEINSQTNQDEIQQYAHLDESLRNWKIWSKQSGNVLEPLLIPMGPILFHYATLQGNAVMMHSSCIFDGEKGRLFSGFSGAGKSTISGIWRDAGSRMINDDRVIIRKENDGYYVYNTPMFYEDEPKKTRLDAVYLIRHAKENLLTRRSGAAAVSGIMAFSIQNNFETQFVQHHLTFFSEMSEVVPVYDLGFVPDSSVIDYIRENS